MMAIKELEAAIESILFALGESVELERIAGAVDHDEETVRNVIRNMMTRYDEEDRGIHIIEMDGAFQLCTKPDMYEYLIKVAHIPKKHVLTDVLLETLSIVAYKQPITRIEIEKIRGVSCDHAVSKLVEYGLIQEVGRMDAPGRPMMFGTTEEFLRYFNYESLDDLPILNQETIDDFKAEVEQELGFVPNESAPEDSFDDLFSVGEPVGAAETDMTEDISAGNLVENDDE